MQNSFLFVVSAILRYITPVKNQTYLADVIIAGGGLAGIVSAYEIIDNSNKKVLLIEKGPREKFGGLAKESFGGIHLIDTPHQRRMGIRDNPELAYRDWESFAKFGTKDELPRKWAKFYCENSLEYIYKFLDHKKIKFLPVVNWPERGMYLPGNSVPRWHITWGTGYEIIFRLLNALDSHKNRKNPKGPCLRLSGVSRDFP